MMTAPSPTPTPEPSRTAPRKGSIWRTVQAVGWSLLGVRKDSEWQQDGAQITPLQIIVVGLVALLVFVLGLMGLVHWLVG